MEGIGVDALQHIIAPLSIVLIHQPVGVVHVAAFQLLQGLKYALKPEAGQYL